MEEEREKKGKDNEEGKEENVKRKMGKRRGKMEGRIEGRGKWRERNVWKMGRFIEQRIKRFESIQEGKLGFRRKKNEI